MNSFDENENLSSPSIKQKKERKCERKKEKEKTERKKESILKWKLNKNDLE